MYHTVGRPMAMYRLCTGVGQSIFAAASALGTRLLGTLYSKQPASDTGVRGFHQLAQRGCK